MSLISLEETINIALSVKDRHASAEWYGSVLGFETIYHADEAGWSELQTKTTGVTIGLGEHTEPVPGNCVPVFGVADLDAARQRWKKPMSNLTAKPMSLKAWSRQQPSMIPTVTR